MPQAESSGRKARDTGDRSPRRRARANSSAAPKTPPVSEDISPLQAGPTESDFSQSAFERHADLLADSRMLEPANATVRSQLVQQLQRDYGNQYVLRLVDHISRSNGGSVQPKLDVSPAGDEYEQEADAVAKRVVNIPAPAVEQSAQRHGDMEIEGQPAHLPGLASIESAPRVMEDEGEKGKEKIEGRPVEMAEASASLDTGEVNEWGEMEGDLGSDVAPKVFVDGGKTGSAIVNWAGGPGGAGNQGVGSITLVAPQYDGQDAPAEGGSATAWIRPGTGTATVTRSYQGVLVGANTPNYYFTAAAAARADVHEQLHVDSSSAIHDTNIAPLETRIAQHTGQENARASGATRDEAIAALQTYIDWNTAITNFRTQDRASNTPMGTVDQADLAAADFIQNYGARAVDGVNYPNYIDTPPGP